ncbi:MAG: aminopeptidase [Oscillospiraceae bacterium]|jgi:aminopeptidase|nr:aminopeptidase [Oscillospiraceae bacterium]
MLPKLDSYAALAVAVGVNLQPGQPLVISCPVDCADFARLIAEKAYDAGASEVVVRWSDDNITRQKYLRADDAVFDTLPQWLEKFFYEHADRGAAIISVFAEDPETLLGVDPNRIARWQKASHAKLKDYYERQMRNDFRWCVVSAPVDAWAEKVFPGREDKNAALWDAICRAADLRGTPEETVAVWQDKVKRLGGFAEKLTAYNFTKLHYKNSLGTDFTVGLPKNHMWSAAGELAADGVRFVANIPTEEVFTLPDRSTADGVVYAALPLVLSGNIIRDIRLTFRNGKIVESYASEGQEFLDAELDLDEGARYLGEVALVPYHSPISALGVLFYNTLFDENAACHLAFGEAYPLFTDVTELSKDEIAARGANSSMTHIDFMIGTPDLSITGITADGREVPVFADGDFAEL